MAEMKIILNGALGKMGVCVSEMIKSGSHGASLACSVDPADDVIAPDHCRALTEFSGDADVIMDFSCHACTSELTSYAAVRKLPLVIATTGQTDAELVMIRAASKYVPVFMSANMSLGVAVLTELVRRAASMMTGADVEITEMHHRGKLDSPSGTALMLASAVNEARGGAERKNDGTKIHSMRLGGVMGKHAVVFATENETITLSHMAHSRALFAEGALAAAKFIIGKDAGLYDMTSLFGGMLFGRDT